ncbi:MAG: hypothetical protein LBL74_00360 [Bacteroidales bacterium]|jgi:hypothetical protein|nr:hypothetical protein [Bacteroidales bacterium]
MCKTDNIKKDFEIHFRNLLEHEPILMDLIWREIFVLGTAYVVGGFLRDFLIKKESRDIDIIVDIKDTNVHLLDIVKRLNCDFTTNRHGGIKIKLKSITVDIWSLENNWAFKNKIVKLNENDKLNSIAKGCFFNYDALVINLHNFSYNIRYYNEFINTKELNILQKVALYKNQNPTTDANIIRAIYIKNKFNAQFTDNTLKYLISKIDGFQNGFKRILDVKSKYPKYNELSDNLLIDELKKIIISANVIPF